jgi:predicted ATPase
VSTFKLPGEVEDREAGEKDTTYHLIHFRLGRVLGGGTGTYGFNQLSLGTRRPLHILVSLIVDRSTIMLVEHPEEGIHSGLVRKLAGLLRANADPAQIILSSHSADVLNALRPAELRLVTIRRGATEAHALTAQQAGAAARFIKEEGSLAEFLESVEEE